MTAGSMIADCMDCGRAFELPQLFGGSANVEIRNSAFGAGCPYCGGDGHIRDGKYKIVGGLVAEFIAIDPEARQRFAEIVQRGVSGGADDDAISAEVTASVPELASFVAKLRAAGFNWDTLLSILVALALFRATPKPPTESQIEKAVKAAVVQELKTHAPPKPTPPPPAKNTPLTTRPPSTTTTATPFVKVSKPSRNSRCYCGSGKKYKQCHGLDAT